MTTYASNDVLEERHQRWRNDPQTETSASAQIARMLWDGETVGSAEVVKRFDCSASLVGVIIRELRQVGWQVQVTRDPDGGNAKLYRVTGRGQPLPNRQARPYKRPSKITPTKLPPTRRAIQPQVVATTRPAEYPQLGASVTVRALALVDDQVVAQLSDGNGRAWQVTITGHVG